MQKLNDIFLGWDCFIPVFTFVHILLWSILGLLGTYFIKTITNIVNNGRDGCLFKTTSFLIVLVNYINKPSHLTLSLLTLKVTVLVCVHWINKVLLFSCFIFLGCHPNVIYIVYTHYTIVLYEYVSLFQIF